MTCKTSDEYDGPLYNNRPVVSRDSDLTLHCRVDSYIGTDDDGNAVYENNCGWTGPASETERGRPKMGSKPRDLLCPECSRRLAAEKGTTGAGYWNGKIP